MKLVLVTDAWLPQVNGVVSTLVELVRQLQARGDEVVVIQPGQFRTRPCPGYAGIDIAVLPGHRGAGVGQALLAAAEQHAKEHGCCKLTLEVLTGNARALKSYLGFGFEPYALDPAAGQASFMQKWL